MSAPGAYESKQRLTSSTQRNLIARPLAVISNLPIIHSRSCTTQALKSKPEATRQERSQPWAVRGEEVMLVAHCPPPALPLSAQEDLHGPAVAAVLCTWLWVAPSDLDYSALQPETPGPAHKTPGAPLSSQLRYLNPLQRFSPNCILTSSLLAPKLEKPGVCGCHQNPFEEQTPVKIAQLWI